MATTPIAICYLFIDGDDNNKCLLFVDELRIIKDGREHIYPLNQEIDFHFTHKKWMFPLVSGWILLCASLLFIFRNLFNSWISLFILVSSVFAIYVGWEGSAILQVNAGSVIHSIPVKRVTNNLKLFVKFVQNYLATRDGNQEQLMIYHMTDRDSWLSQISESTYSHKSLHKDGFIHCSTHNQVLDTFDQYFEGCKDLILLAVNPLKLSSQLKLEIVLPRDDLFPHIYGPINKDAIVLSREFGNREELITLLKK